MSRFQLSAVFRIANRLVTPLIRVGVPLGLKRAPMALLTVKGRNSGQARTTPISLINHDQGWLLVSVYGVGDWSRNLEVAREAEITLRGRIVSVAARRLPPSEAAPILRDSIADAPALIRRMTEPYFSANEESPIEDWEDEASAHPVFVLTPAAEQPTS